GLRLLQPQGATNNAVPDLCLRGDATCQVGEMTAPAEMQPALHAFPVPNGILTSPDGWAEYIGSWSNPSSINSTSVRFDQAVSDKLRLFFRFSDTGSAVSARGGSGFSPATVGTSAYT